MDQITFNPDSVLGSSAPGSAAPRGPRAPKLPQLSRRTLTILAACIGGVLILALVLGLLLPAVTGGGKFGAFRSMEKYANKKSYDLLDAFKDNINDMDEGHLSAIYELYLKSEEGEDFLQRFEDSLLDRYEENQDKYGDNFKIRYIVDKESAEDLDEEELERYEARLQEFGLEILDLAEEYGEDDDALEETADELGLSVRDVKKLVRHMKALGDLFLDIRVTDGCLVDYTVKITGSELDDPEEQDYTATLLKINGRWLTFDSLNALDFIF